VRASKILSAAAAPSVRTIPVAEAAPGGTRIRIVVLARHPSAHLRRTFPPKGVFLVFHVRRLILIPVVATSAAATGHATPSGPVLEQWAASVIFVLELLRSGWLLIESLQDERFFWRVLLSHPHAR
jgi:hypothetical protein